MNKEPRYNEVVVDFVDRVHGTGSPEIRPWRPQLTIPVEFVDVVPGTDSSAVSLQDKAQIDSIGGMDVGAFSPRVQCLEVFFQSLRHVK